MKLVPGQPVIWRRETRGGSNCIRAKVVKIGTARTTIDAKLAKGGTKRTSVAPPSLTPACEKCGNEIKGEVYVWEHWKWLCWPCKKPLLDAAVPGALKALKAELESPASQEAIRRMLSDDPKDRS